MGEELLDLGLTDSEIESLNLEKYSCNARVEDGLLTGEELQAAYRENLQLVLTEVKRLITFLDCPVVVSADHGEHLGEYTDEIVRYFHPDQTHPVFREVPWFVVDVDARGAKDFADADIDLSSVGDYNSEVSDEEIQEQLAALGYQ